MYPGGSVFDQTLLHGFKKDGHSSSGPPEDVFVRHS